MSSLPLFLIPLVTPCLISLGSNLGQRRRVLHQAIDLLAALPKVSLVRRSRWRTTRPIGGPPGQDLFLNGVVVCETTLSPQQLLSECQHIEDQLGRDRHERWGARHIDLDLLLHGNTICQKDELTLPHPRMLVRRFVLEPAVEVAGDWIHPQLGWTLHQAFTHLSNSLPYIALTGCTESVLTEVARAVCENERFRFLGAVRPATAPTVPDVQQGIKFLRRRASILRNVAELVVTPGVEAVVSNFWWDDFLAEGAGRDSPAEWIAVADELLPCIPSPRLLVLVEESRVSPPTRSAHSGWVPGGSAIRKYLMTSGAQCPYITVSDEDRLWSEHQIVAAIDAMMEKGVIEDAAG
jgi:2-amino-4-hydroxy-6-hydroxymethyldihydropteridine diphosphokinase